MQDDKASTPTVFVLAPNPETITSGENKPSVHEEEGTDFEEISPAFIAGSVPNPENPNLKNTDENIRGLWLTAPEEEGHRRGFGFYPENVYGKQNWIPEHQMLIASWFRKNLVDFARSLAGTLYPGVKESEAMKLIMTTGFEDVHDLIDSARSRGYPTYQGGEPVNLDKSTSPLFDPSAQASTLATFTRPFDRPGQTGFNEALDELFRLSRIIKTAEMPDVQIPQLREYLTRQSERRETAYLKWFTLPFTLKETYFSSTAKSVIESALVHCAQSLDRVHGNMAELFGEILLSSARWLFVELAGVINKLKLADSGNRYTAKHTREGLQYQLFFLLFQIVQTGLRPNPSYIACLPTVEGNNSTDKMFPKTKPTKVKIERAKKVNLQGNAFEGW